MSVRRALVDCVVLSLQDTCLFYPCCKGCWSRIDVEQQDTTSCRCSRCGYSCLREQVDYRYRLSLKVARDGCIFGVTVFGACLNPFFGIHASGLQRLVENLDGPIGASTRSTLLQKAVGDCFIGRHFIFGIKVPEAESVPWLRGPAANGSSSKDTDHFIASQMILPNATGLGGCTVVSYYRILLQKATEYELGSTDPSKTSRPPATTLLLIRHHSPASSLTNGTLSSPGLLSQSLQRSQNQDCTLTPTPPWQQSLGLVTSSAEQEEGCSTEDSGDETSRQRDNFKTPHHAHTGCPQDLKVTEETVLSPLPSLDCSSYNHLSFEKTAGNTPILNTWFSPSPPGLNSSKEKRFSTTQLTETSLPSSLDWEDFPFSESLTEFLCDENKNVDVHVSEAEPRLNVQNQKETTRNNLGIRSQDNNSTIESTSVCQSNTKETDSLSQILLDITNTPVPNGGDRCDLSDQLCKNPAGCVNKSQARNICSHECNQGDEEASSLSFENEEEEQLEGDTYNCSADLFSSSPVIAMNTNTLNTHAETVRTITEACPLPSKLDKQHMRSEKANFPPSTPDTQKLKSKKSIHRDSLILPGTQDLDFIPPSQSTPILKVAVVPGSRTLTLGEFTSQPNSQDSCPFHRNLPELDGKNPSKITSSPCKLNCVGANRLCQCGRESTKENLMWSLTSSRHRFTPKRRFWRPDKHKNHMLAQQHLRVQRGALNHKFDSSDCDVTARGPPTPATKTRLSVKLRGRRPTGNSSSSLGYTWEVQQGDGVSCKRTLLDQTLTSSQRGLAQTGNRDSETADEERPDGSNQYRLDDENEACDWSRDLFSDSV